MQVALNPISSPEALLVESPVVVLDYQALNNAWVADQTFYSDVTYLVSGICHLSGTTIIEGGTVVKYAAGAGLNINGSMVSQTSSYRPAVFTAKDDNTVGETINGSTGHPWGYYANPALSFDNSQPVTWALSHFRIAYAHQAIWASSISFWCFLSHGQMVNCASGISGPGQGEMSLRNLLFENVQYAFLNSSYVNFHVENTTFALGGGGFPRAPAFLAGAYPASGTLPFSIELKNCVLANITAPWIMGNGASGGTLSGEHNGFYNSPPPMGTFAITTDIYPFQRVGGGKAYLAGDSVFRNAGTLSITPSLLAELRETTTEPPIYLTGSLTTPRTVGQDVPRDVDGLDLGYHYPAVDYLISGLDVVSTTLTLRNGLTVAVDFNAASYGIRLSAGHLVSTGEPKKMNRILPANAVQEWPLVTSAPYQYTLTDVAVGTSYPEARLRFTEFSQLSSGSYYYVGSSPRTLEFKDCQFFGGKIYGSFYQSDAPHYGVRWQNNLFEKVHVTLLRHVPMYLNVFNNTFVNGSLSLYYGTVSQWTLRDNIFDTLTLQDNGSAVANSQNAYRNMSGGGLQGSGQNFILRDTYQTGPLGHYYLPAASALRDPVNPGASRTVAAAGLYHYTTCVEQAKEGTTPLDIGFHYVAVGPDGEPLDSDEDGLADYLENRNGDGQVALSETNWLEADTDGDGLSDFEEWALTRTNPLQMDSGDTGSSDAFKDSDSDGWTNLEELRNGTHPYQFNTPPPPYGFRVVQNPNGSATLHWEPSLGAVSGYRVERDTGSGFTPLATLSAAQTSYADNTIAAGTTPIYRVIVEYANGARVASENRPLTAVDPRMAALVALTRGPGGTLKLIASAVPENLSTLRLYRDVYQNYYPDFYDNCPSYVPIGNGSMDIPAPELRNQGYVYTLPPTFAPAYGLYGFRYQWFDPQGKAGPVLSATPFCRAKSRCLEYPFWVYVGNLIRQVPFLDGSAVLEDNLKFMLRAQRAGEPFRFMCHVEGQQEICHPDYAEAGLYYAPDLNEFNPFEQNHFLRNWGYAPGDFYCEPDGCFFGTGVYPDGVGYGFDPRGRRQLYYLFPEYEFVSSANADLLNSLLGGEPAQFIYLQRSAPAYFEQPGYDLSNAGITRTADGLGTQLAAGFRNVFDLTYRAARLVRTDSGTVEDLQAGGTVVNNRAAVPREYFQEVEEPMLVTVGDYFGTIEDWQPGDSGFKVNGPSPLLVTALSSNAVQLFGWAQQSINGSATKWAYRGHYFDQAFKTDAAGHRTSQHTGILSEYGEFFPTEPGHVILTTKPDQNQRQGQCHVHVIALSTDANRDGVIDGTFTGPDHTSAQQPWRFWINDDNDWGELGGTDIAEGGKRADGNWSRSLTIDGVRDLVDFFPVYLDIGSVVSALPPGPTVQYLLRQDDSALNFAYTELRADQFRQYLTDLTVARSLGSAATLQIPAAGVSLDATFLNQIPAEGKGLILVEASAKTSQPLILEVRQDGHPVAQAALYLSIDGVEKMFRHHNLIERAFPPQRDGLPSRLADADVPNEPLSNGKNFVFVHGYNVNPSQGRGSFAEWFKRLYWSGSHARFYGVTWKGYESQWKIGDRGLVTPNYHRNVNNAFRTAPWLADFLLSLPGENTLAGHSLGNLVVLSALSDWSAPIANYFMIDAAVAIEAVEGSAAHNPAMAHPAWADYDERLWASEWHNRSFPERDYRRQLTWRDRLANFRTTQVYNFYSSGDEVLAEHVGPPPSVPLALFQETLLYGLFSPEPRGSYVWAWQEKMKGRTAGNWVLGSNHGGWGFNTPDYGGWTPAQAAQLSDEQLRQRPFFDLSYDPDLYGANGSPYAQANGNRLLSDAFPARTLPVGANEVARLSPQGQPSRNFDMNTEYKNGWPFDRPSDNRWLHSDVRQVAYMFIYRLFDSFVTLGELR
jgi:hypothetical protein